MNADLSYSSGEMTIDGYSLDSSAVTITNNWWQKYGRIVEFQLEFTSNTTISSGSALAGGLPRAAQNATYTTFGATGNVIVNNYSSGASLNNTIGLNGSVILHGVYISES